MDIWSAAGMGMLAGVVGTGLGGLASFILRRPSNRLLSVLMHITGGIMLSMVCFHLLPEAFAVHSMAMGLGGLFLGVGFVVVLDRLISSRLSSKEGFLKAGILMTVGIAIHNFPEGLAIGSGYAETPALGLGMAALIMMHDLPEGMAMGVPLREGGIGLGRVMLYTILSGVPTGIGAIVGYAAGAVSTVAVSLSMGSAAGAMLYLVCSELLPQSAKLHRGAANGIALSVGVALGIALGQAIM